MIFPSRILGARSDIGSRLNKWAYHIERYPTKGYLTDEEKVIAIRIVEDLRTGDQHEARIMVKVLMEKFEDSLHPVDEASKEAIRNVPEKSIVAVNFSVPRNIRMHRLFFALLKLTFEAQQEPKAYPTQDKLLDALKLGVGYTREVRDLQGKTHIVPDSIAFGRMDQVAFKQFFDSVVNLIIERIVPRVGKKDFEQQLMDMLREPGPDQIGR